MPNREIMTIGRHIADRQVMYPGATGELSDLLYDIALAGKLIAREVTHAGLNEILGLAGGINVQGEEQKKLDVYANDVLVGILTAAGRTSVIVSEEDEDVLPVPTENGGGKYAVVFDPLDGSSNTDVNVSIATIFGIYRRRSTSGSGTLDDVLQPGRDLVAAGYILYGPGTMLVYSAGDGVHAFTLDLSLGEFLLSHDNITIPDQPLYYSVNQGSQSYWSDGVRAYTGWLQGLDAQRPRKPLSSRYIGSFAADVHRNLMEGGIFYYPSDTKDPEMPDGKLRLLYEAAPMAFLVEQAGGTASNGTQRILDIEPHSLHQRTPLFIGSRGLVEEAEGFLRQHDRK